MKKIRVGVVGVGHIGKNHARIYGEIPQAEFVAVLETDRAAARAAEEAYGVEAVATLDAFAERVEAASICTPTPGHHPVARELLARGRHVLVEKPITETTAQARELVELASRKGCILQVGHVERFNPVLAALEKRLKRPRFIEAHRLSPYPGRSTDIGVVLDLMIHDLEVILHLVRSPVASIDAVGIPVLSKGEDIANARLRFADGCVANITSSRISPEPEPAPSSAGRCSSRASTALSIRLVKICSRAELLARTGGTSGGTSAWMVSPALAALPVNTRAMNAATSATFTAPACSGLGRAKRSRSSRTFWACRV